MIEGNPDNEAQHANVARELQVKLVMSVLLDAPRKIPFWVPAKGVVNTGAGVFREKKPYQLRLWIQW